MRNRGTASVETALMMPLALMSIFGMINLGILELTQLEADGAAFNAAHTFFFQPSVNAAAQAKSLYTMTSSATMLQNRINLQTPADNLDYYQGAYPLQYVVRIKSSLNIPFIGQFPYTMQGVGFEFGSSTYIPNPLGVAVDDDAGIAPKMFESNVMQSCSYQEANSIHPTLVPPPWPAKHWIDCPDTPNGSQQTFSVRPLGLAMRLDYNNQARPILGVFPRYNGADGLGRYNGATFWETLYHQQLYAQAGIHMSWTPMPLAQAAADTWAATLDADPVIREINTFDTIQPSYYAANVTHVATGSH